MALPPDDPHPVMDRPWMPRPWGVRRTLDCALLKGDVGSRMGLQRWSGLTYDSSWVGKDEEEAELDEGSPTIDS
jgi:hypothetical protein